MKREVSEYGRGLPCLHFACGRTPAPGPGSRVAQWKRPLHCQTETCKGKCTKPEGPRRKHTHTNVEGLWKEREREGGGERGGHRVTGGKGQRKNQL